MAKLRVLYWKEIPIQIQAEDKDGTVSVPLDDRFQEGADLIAVFDGSVGTDKYLEAWEWGNYINSTKTATLAASELADQFNAGFPRDFVTRIRHLHETGQRDSRPGTIDNWAHE